MDNSKPTPGWNDPPLLDHGVKTSIPKSRITNKRIAFPLSNSQQLTPQLHLTHIPEASNAQHIPLNINVNNSDSELLEKILVNFDKLLCDKNDYKNKEIYKKIDLMKNMWETGKLTDGVKNILLEISELLLKGDDDNKVNELHLKLVMEHSTLCQSWIVGIKQLIHKIKEK